MPIIAIRDNPPSQLQKRSIIDIDGKWWIAKTKPQQEKQLAFQFLEREIEYYLPYYTKVSLRSDGKSRKSTLVLFPSYVPFVSSKPYSILDVKNVSTIIPIESQTKFKVQLNEIYRAYESGYQIHPIEINAVNIGDTVRILFGTLKGITGKVVRIQDKLTLLLTIEGLGNAGIIVSSNQIEMVVGNSIVH